MEERLYVKHPVSCREIKVGDKWEVETEEEENSVLLSNSPAKVNPQWAENKKIKIKKNIL